jgi:hypothetical protein
VSESRNTLRCESPVACSNTCDAHIDPTYRHCDVSYVYIHNTFSQTLVFRFLWGRASVWIDAQLQGFSYSALALGACCFAQVARGDTLVCSRTGEREHSHRKGSEINTILLSYYARVHIYYMFRSHARLTLLTNQRIDMLLTLSYLLPGYPLQHSAILY